MIKNILIISNDKLFIKNNVISSNYNDTVNIIEGLAKKNYLSFFCRLANKRQNFFSKDKKYNKFEKLNLFNLNKIDNHKIFMISITPFNLLTLLILKILNKNIDGHVYIRSDGHKEYYYKYGIIGKIAFDIMFKIVRKFLKIICVSKKITGIKKNYSIINPSEIDRKWLLNRSKPKLNKPKLLYLGRYKKEKGIFSLINIINSLKVDLKLNIVGTNKQIISQNKNIKYLRQLNSIKKIIKCYDECSIFVLPSFTEGAPKVILESLARLRPVIIFDEIKHVKKKFNGIFISKRNSKEFLKNIYFILNNYERIVKKMKKNKIFTKEHFQKEINKII